MMSWCFRLTRYTDNMAPWFMKKNLQWQKFALIINLKTYAIKQLFISASDFQGLISAMKSLYVIVPLLSWRLINTRTPRYYTNRKSTTSLHLYIRLVQRQMKWLNKMLPLSKCMDSYLGQVCRDFILTVCFLQIYIVSLIINAE